MATIKQMIEDLAKCRSASLHDHPFCGKLAMLQDALGQDDGGFAGVFFSDYEDNCWQWMGYEQKIDILREYVRGELAYIVDEDDDSGAIEEVCSKCGTRVTGQKDHVSPDYVRACLNCDEDLFGVEVNLKQDGKIIQNGIDTSEEETE